MDGRLVTMFLLFLATISEAQQASSGRLIKGLSWIGSDSIITASFDEAVGINANWISVITYGHMTAHNLPTIEYRDDHQWWGDTDRGIKKTAELAHAKGLKVMLKPHIILPSHQKKWRHDIKMKNHKDWLLWFTNYERWILYHARFANDQGIEMLCVGTELYNTTSKYPDQWRSIIKKVRSVYKGKIVYAANWYREVNELSFWDALDMIGVQGYYPLSKKNKPQKQDLLKSWSKIKRQLKKLSKRKKRKILFTEIGYKNTIDATQKPWIWIRDLGQTHISNATQKNAYSAFFETFWDEGWVSGAFIWRWHHPTFVHTDMEDYFQYRRERLQLWGTQINKTIDPRIDFSPQGKEAFEVLRIYFSQD